MPGNNPEIPDLDSLLRCPATGQRLQRLSPEECLSFPGEFKEGGFQTEDGSALYPVRNGFPLLVSGEEVKRVSESETQDA